MKFIIIAYSEIDGVGQHVISLNENLNKLGHESKAILLHKSKKIDKNIILIKSSFFYRGIFLWFANLQNLFKKHLSCAKYGEKFFLIF